MDTKDATKVATFLTHTRVATRNEIASGCDISRASVQSILDVVVSDGAVIRTGSEDNTATYSLAGISPVTEATAAGPVLTESEKWAIDARKQGLASWKESHPEEYLAPTSRRTISDVEVDAEMAKRKVEPLTEAERRSLEIATRNRTPRNPQERIVR